MLKQDDIERKEERLRQQINELPAEERKAYYRLAKKRIKDPDTYAVLVYFFMIGIHHIYLGYYVRGIVNMVLFLTGFVVMVNGDILMGLLLVISVPAMELWDLFRSQIIVQNRNNTIMEQLLKEIRLHSPVKGYHPEA